jgi:ribonuclease P protein component
LKDYSLPKEYRLLNKRDFASLRSKDAIKVHCKTFKVIYRNNGDNHARLGFAISKKVGKANVRNTIKRYLREWFRQSELKNKPCDLFIIVHPKYKLFGPEIFYETLNQELRKIVVKI